MTVPIARLIVIADWMLGENDAPNNLSTNFFFPPFC